MHWTWIWELYNTDTTPSNSTQSEWGWDGVSSVTREVTYDPDIERLVFYPVKELEGLRDPTPLVQQTAMPVPVMAAGDRLPAAPLSPATGIMPSTLDIEVEVRWVGWAEQGRPPAGQLVLSILAAPDGSEFTNVVYDTARITDGWAEWMPQTDLPCNPGVQPGCDANCSLWPTGQHNAKSVRLAADCVVNVWHWLCGNSTDCD